MAPEGGCGENTRLGLRALLQREVSAPTGPPLGALALPCPEAWDVTGRLWAVVARVSNSIRLERNSELLRALRAHVEGDASDAG